MTDEWGSQVAERLAAVGGAEIPALEPEVVTSWLTQLPAGYKERTSPQNAADDLWEMLRLGGEGHSFGVRADSTSDQVFRLRRLAATPIELTSFIPVLESFGLAVVEAVPAHLSAPGGGRYFLDDFGVRRDNHLGTVSTDSKGSTDSRNVPDGGTADRFVAALDAVVAGRAEVDSLNRLVLTAGFDWGQVSLLLAYRRYRCVASNLPDTARLDDPFVAQPVLSRALVAYFEASFDPKGEGPGGEASREARARILRDLEAVTDLEQDQALRALLALLDATVRTNWYNRGEDEPIVLKFDSGKVPGLPSPVPLYETFVHSSRVEGIHLRFGAVARGGLRWSTRPEDFRMEILDLADAQVKKNAIIVPTGAKGGFVCRAPAPTPQEVRRQYETFVGGLLDVTDNIVDGEVVPPVARADGDDPYLVIAADKGTATFSDLANEISLRRGFWMGDAFASGGSTGYDHKAMGITARGAWTAVVRHFRQLGIDVATEPFRVAGVGDMSGDVFGNGMLLSKSMKLVAAFDHRHIFIDPAPDPGASFEERSRLAKLSQSSWNDYNRHLISPGGGVWSRQTARINLPAEAATAVGLAPGEVSPPQLISAILKAPVDLLFFGGIGTFIKAPDENDVEVADHANDGLRVTADQVRARVIAEGGNLGVTQRGRILYSRRGGRINTDFIDNAAGVATSDREVNLKILLALAVTAGRLDDAGRVALLASVGEDVAADVLRGVDHSVAALSRAVPGSASNLPAYESLLEDLEGLGLFTRSVEALPSAQELERRTAAGAGLIRPELAVLLAYAKLHLVGAVVASPVPDSDAFRGPVAEYFPEAIRDRFADLIPEHRLYRELASTALAGELVDRMGITWTHETAAELGCGLDRVASCWWAACEVLQARPVWDALEDAASKLTSDEETRLHVEMAEAVDVVARGYLADGVGLDPAARIKADRPVAQELRRLNGAKPSTSPEEGAEAIAGLGQVGQIASVGRRSERSVEEAADAVASVQAAAGLGQLKTAIAKIEPAGRWSRWQIRGLLDDLESYAGEAAVRALAGAKASIPPAEAVRAWVEEHQEALAGARDAAREVRAADAEALPRAALAVRHLLGSLR